MRINIFYLIAGLSSLLLVAILWIFFVPSFYGTGLYEVFRNLALIMSTILIIVALIQIYLAVQREKADLEGEV